MPDINSREPLEAWLQDKPHGWGGVIAHRAALRVLPIALNPAWFRDTAAHLALPAALLRASLLSRLASIHPSHKFTSVHSAARDADATSTIESHAGNYAPHAARAAIGAAYCNARPDDYLFAQRAADMANAAAYAAHSAAFADFHAPSALYSDRAATDSVWASIKRDCDSLDERSSPITLLELPLWDGAVPDWLQPVLRAMESHLHSLDRDFDLWIDWYRRRIIGDASGFGLPVGHEEELSRRLIEATDEWWKREPALVNGDIKAWIKELNPAAVPDEAAFAQNPFAEIFAADANGQVGLAPPSTENGLIDDADSRRFHSEAKRTIEAAIAASGVGVTQATDMLAPLQLVLDASGESVQTANPQALVTRIETVRALNDQRASENETVTPFTPAQAIAILALIKSCDAWIAFDGKLATIRDGTYGPDHPRGAADPQIVRVVIEQAKAMGVARADAHEVLTEAANSVPVAAPPDDRRRITLGARFANFIRATGRFIWTHKGKVTTGGVAAAIAFINKNADTLVEMFSWSQTLVEIIKWIGKLTL